MPRTFQTWKTIARHVLLQHSKYLQVENHTIELPNGHTLADWPWIITPEYAIVVAMTGDGRFILFKQTKYAVEGTTLAPVGGYLEPGEAPLAAAIRELREETGYQSQDWVHLGSYVVDGNHGAGRAHLFLARQAHLAAQPQADDLEEQELVLFSRAEVEQALQAGEFKVLAWTAAMSLALPLTGTNGSKPEADPE